MDKKQRSDALARCMMNSYDGIKSQLTDLVTDLERTFGVDKNQMCRIAADDFTNRVQDMQE